MDLSKVPEQTKEKQGVFSTAAQIGFRYFLYHQDEVINTTDFADIGGLHVMTASRALNE